MESEDEIEGFGAPLYNEETGGEERWSDDDDGFGEAGYEIVTWSVEETGDDEEATEEENVTVYEDWVLIEVMEDWDRDEDDIREQES